MLLPLKCEKIKGKKLLNWKWSKLLQKAGKILLENTDFKIPSDFFRGMLVGLLGAVLELKAHFQTMALGITR